MCGGGAIAIESIAMCGGALAIATERVAMCGSGGGGAIAIESITMCGVVHSPSNALPCVVQVQTRSRRLVDARWTPAKVHAVQVTRAHLCPKSGDWSVRIWEMECPNVGIGVS